MKKIILTGIFLLLSINILASTYEAPMSIYNDNYILAGNKTDQLKFQISAKYNLLWPYNSGIYLGYTQMTHWWMYGNRDTMHTQYQPEFFYRFESGNNAFEDYVIPYVDYIQVSPFYHCSTGVEGENHRSVNEYYGQIQLSVGDVYNFGTNLKVFGYYEKDENNKDINKYKKNYTADFFFKLRSKTVQYLDKEELHCTIGGNPLGRGFIQGEIIVRLMTTAVQPRVFVQYFRGFDQYMTTYNIKETCIRGGLIFLN